MKRTDDYEALVVPGKTVADHEYKGSGDVGLRSPFDHPDCGAVQIEVLDKYHEDIALKALAQGTPVQQIVADFIHRRCISMGAGTTHAASEAAQPTARPSRSMPVGSSAAHTREELRKSSVLHEGEAQPAK